MAKVLYLTRHTQSEFGEHRMNFIKETHGKKTTVTFDDYRFTGSMQQQIDDCVQYLKWKVELGYIIYVVLPKFLMRAMLENGISFYILSSPKKVDKGTKIGLEFYSPDKPLGDTKAIKVIPKHKESAGYINTSGKKGAAIRRK